jgi:hypothetical protein
MAAAKAAFQRIDSLRNALVGQAAPSIAATHWLNAPPGTSAFPLADGTVRLIEFTAHWCTPCKASYPPLQALHDRLKARGFSSALVTRVYGYFGSPDTISVEAELDSVRRFYLQRYALTFPVAIDDSPLAPYSGVSIDANSNERRYYVVGVPEFILIDRKGQVRGVWNGFGEAMFAAMTAMVDSCVAEPRPAVASGRGR